MSGMPQHADAHESKEIKKRNSSSSNEYEQVFERYAYETYKMEFDTLLEITKAITKCTTFIVPTLNTEAAKENQNEVSSIKNPPGEQWMTTFGSTMNKISRELTSKSKTVDEREKSSKILKAMSNYSQKAKMILVIAAFAVKYGKVCLTANLYALNPVAGAVASLRRQHSVLNRPEYLTQWHKGLAEIINKMLQLIDFELRKQGEGDKKPSKAVLLIIECAIVCSSQMMAILISDEHIRRKSEKSSTPYEWDHCVLNKALDEMLADVPDKTTQEIVPVYEPDSTKSNGGEKATPAKKGTNKGKSKRSSSGKDKPVNVCC